MTTDEIAEHGDVFALLPRAPQLILAASLVDQLIGHDIAAAASGCKVSVAYISSARSLETAFKIAGALGVTLEEYFRCESRGTR